MKLIFWVAWRTMGQAEKKMSLSSWVSLIGIILGVASLVVSMAVMSGYEQTLQSVIVDIAGDAQVFQTKPTNMSFKEFSKTLTDIDPNVRATSAFAMVEAIAAQNGMVMGAIVHGVESENIQKVIKIKSRLVEGNLNLTSTAPYGVVLGKVLAEKLKLKVGDHLNVVIPISSDYDPTHFRRRMGVLKVEGIIDFGKYDYNERTIITDLKVAQDLGELKKSYSGMMVKLKSSDDAAQFTEKVIAKLGTSYWARSWRDLNASLFEAVELEKVAIFFVVFIIIVVAAFNVSSSLYINVVQRYAQISLLKALGFSQRQILWIFTLQGVFMGMVGVLTGYILGIAFCQGFLLIQKHFHLLPAEVYQLDFIGVSVNFKDSILIIFVTLVITLLSALAPALKGSKMQLAEGLRYE